MKRIVRLVLLLVISLPFCRVEASAYELTRAERDSVACALATVWGNYLKTTPDADGETINLKHMPKIEEMLIKETAKNPNDKGSKVGATLIQRLKQVEMMGDFKINREKFAYELGKSFKGRNTGFTVATAESYMNHLLTRIAKENYVVNNGPTFFAEVAKREGIEKTPSGLLFETLREGDGESPCLEDVVLVNYKGYLIDGTVFNESKPDAPKTFIVAETIKGLSEGLQKMKKGGHYRLYVPAELGYGKLGLFQKVPSNAAIIFDVELLKLRPLTPEEKMYYLTTPIEQK